jgi:hypothetical protein
MEALEREPRLYDHSESGDHDEDHGYDRRDANVLPRVM